MNIKATVFNNHLAIKSVNEPNSIANSRNQLRTISLKNKYHLTALQKQSVLFNLVNFFFLISKWGAPKQF